MSSKLEEGAFESEPLGGSDLKPMDVAASGVSAANASGASSWSDWATSWFNSKKKVPRKYKLVTDGNYRRNSMRSLQFAVLVSAISTKMLAPNYAIMCATGQHEDAFPTTAPFAFNSATYFIPMCSLLGVAIASTIVGKLSDRVGRKVPLLVMMWVSAGGNIVKFFTRETFWGFCAANFAFGFFLGNLPVAMAYAGDIFSSKTDKEAQLGMLVGNFVTGNAGGGMIAILMNGSGLFSPLWVGAGLCVVSAIALHWYLIEPGDDKLAEEPSLLKNEEEEVVNRPTEINQCLLWNIIGGALADNFGSTALFPMCLSPLAIEQYTLGFPAGEEILSVTGYQWLSVCVALLVIPSTLITPLMFKRIGVAGTCVFGNIFTGLLTMALLFIGGYSPATQLAFGFFVFVMYGGFPFTVFSQLTTGPMLDYIAPEDKLGFVQGLNNSAMNFGMAVAPWIFGIIADVIGTNASIWIGIGISFLAGAINTPLMFRDGLGKPKPKTPAEKRVLPDEEGVLGDYAEKAIEGEYIDPAVLWAINRQRAKENKPFIVPTVRPFSEDKENLEDLRSFARDNFRFRMELQDHVLSEMSNPKREMDVETLCDLVNHANKGDPQIVEDATRDVGQWIADYLRANGYHPHTNSLLLKQMVLSAFPTINVADEDGTARYTPDNVEEALLRSRAIMSRYYQHEEERYSLFRKVLGHGQRPQFYT